MQELAKPSQWGGGMELIAAAEVWPLQFVFLRSGLESIMVSPEDRKARPKARVWVILFGKHGVPLANISASEKLPKLVAAITSKRFI